MTRHRAGSLEPNGTGAGAKVRRPTEPFRKMLRRTLGEGEIKALAGSLDAYLGLYAPGGNGAGQCRVVAFVLVGVGLAEVGHGLVEGA
jgi:hypothetical protein